jgi:secondary thiamine-phosphate synthase enzyme
VSDVVRFEVKSREHSQVIDITDDINQRLSEFTGASAVNLWVPHTTAGVTVNESADPNVMSDMMSRFQDLVPWEDDYDHIEDNAAAHIKSMMLGSHQWLPVDGERLDLGRWQGVFLLEWDGPRKRTIRLSAET